MKKVLLFSLSASLFLMGCGSSKSVSTTTNTTQSSATAVSSSSSKSTYWQQHVDYKMEIDMDVNNYQYQGKQKLVYTNNSPDVLDKVFYHLYFNAFQPGSDMDARLQSIVDPDGRMVNEVNGEKQSRISTLKPNEIGYINVTSLKQNGSTVKHITAGTVLEVTLNKAIQPGESVTFDMVFDAQVPVQIRRSGRNNAEGVALSMTQWYPKLSEYDSIQTSVSLEDCGDL